MNKSLVTLGIALCYLSSAPAVAHPPSKSPIDTALPDTNNPCTLNSSFLSVHETLINLGQVAIQVGDEAHRLHHTTLARPYKRIEVQSSDITTRMWPQLVKLTDMRVAIDLAPETPTKQAALDLITTYQSALTQIADYTHAAVYLEHTENALSFNFRNAYLNFGVPRMAPQMAGNNQALFFFDTRFTEAKDALRMLDFPEHRYSLSCHMSFSPSITRRQR